MPRLEDLHQAQINRSIRTIKAELEYLCDASVISPHELSDLLSRVPAQTTLHAPLSVGAIPNFPTPNDAASNLSNLSLDHSRNNNNNPTSPTPSSNNLNEKSSFFHTPTPSTSSPYQPPPPQASWNAPRPPLANATALYAYSSSDDGDLELQPGDSIAVTEYMNAEWWKGRSARTGREGIFPRSYVRVVEDGEKAAMAASGGFPVGTQGGYGSQPITAPVMENGMAQGQPAPGHVPSKFEQQGKKFGKKLGNAAIFGAGATIGSDIVNAIL